VATVLTLNERALRLADHLVANTRPLRCALRLSDAGARIIDCGVQEPGGLQAGLSLARVCLSGLGEVSLAPASSGDIPCVQVAVSTDHPVLACMASQYAGWQISVGSFFGMGSGPMRAAYGKEALFDKIAGREESAIAVGVLETRRFPDDAVIAHLCEKLSIAPGKLTLLVAPASSIAGTVQVVARSLETALHKMFELGFDLSTIVSGFGSAPLPPPGRDELEAIGRTNDAILYGGKVTLWVQAEDERLTEIGPKVPSYASPDYGLPFAAIFERYERDFYKIDPKLFSPAQVVFHNLKSGRSHIFGQAAPEILRRSFFAGA
jgi:methenyltetrahydromethanopterin cyclohydrolase